MPVSGGPLAGQGAQHPAAGGSRRAAGVQRIGPSADRNGADISARRQSGAGAGATRPSAGSSSPARSAISARLIRLASSAARSSGSRSRPSTSQTRCSGNGASPTASHIHCGPRPTIIASGMPPRNCDGLVSGVLKSAWASIQTSVGSIPARLNRDSSAAIPGQRGRPRPGAQGFLDELGDRPVQPRHAFGRPVGDPWGCVRSRLVRHRAKQRRFRVFEIERSDQPA